MLKPFMTALLIATSSLSANAKSKEKKIIAQYHLDSREGLMTFVEEKIFPFILEMEQLNNELESLSQQISEINPSEEDAVTRLYLQMNEKMTILLENRPLLEQIDQFGVDFERIDKIITTPLPPGKSEEKMLKRLASICEMLENR